jgi:hypothetical protein
MALKSSSLPQYNEEFVRRRRAFGSVFGHIWVQNRQYIANPASSWFQRNPRHTNYNFDKLVRLYDERATEPQVPFKLRKEIFCLLAQEAKMVDYEKEVLRLAKEMDGVLSIWFAQPILVKG